MEENVRRFDGKVAEYARYRERYAPDILLPLLRDWCGLTPEWKVADIGAGTGLLSDIFVANGNRVLAVEPNVEMREMFARLHEESSLIEIIDGTAENTSLEDGSVEMVTAGRAMHWFDTERAMEEFRRILKPGGWIAIIAFGRAQAGREENEAFEELLRERATDNADSHAGYGVYRRMEEYLASDFLRKEIAGTMSLDWDELYGMTMSLSHAPRMEDPRYPPFERALREYFERYAEEGRVTLATRYWINLGRFAAS
ncbi:class I SAM-dependent methyltransferase [Granulicella sp. dw_53]|uniref:class I SAM-dependent methyltransferase n=1 Tax=Granulicella sp. dw_53 TaxID=2719792 RepID=UPI001BD24E24|nr:class I SAM-dependent methyltransferase [Granulicella sp. dw_53]